MIDLHLPLLCIMDKLKMHEANQKADKMWPLYCFGPEELFTQQLPTPWALALYPVPKNSAASTTVSYSTGLLGHHTLSGVHVPEHRL